MSARLAAVGDLSKSISQSIRDPIARARDELEGLSVDWHTNELILELHRLTDECQEAVAEGHELIAECAEGVERIFSIVQEVGSFSEEGLQGDLDEHSLARIVERALRVARAQAPDWMRIEDRLDPNVLIRCRFGQIERVVTNLLVNAIHALQDNDRARANLVVAVGAQGDRALLHVEDDGCGIESEALDRIFDPFFTTKPVGKGTGLGLAISYHTVKAHGGAIRVSSVVGRGTSVTVELPRAPSPGRSLRTDASGARPHRTG